MIYFGIFNVILNQFRNSKDEIQLLSGICAEKLSPSPSSSSSSAVVVTPVEDIHTLEWEDESDDLNLEEEITEEELKKMVEQLANKETDPVLDVSCKFIFIGW